MAVLVRQADCKRLQQFCALGRTVAVVFGLNSGEVLSRTVKIKGDNVVLVEEKKTTPDSLQVLFSPRLKPFGFVCC